MLRLRSTEGLSNPRACSACCGFVVFCDCCCELEGSRPTARCSARERFGRTHDVACAPGLIERCDAPALSVEREIRRWRVQRATGRHARGTADRRSYNSQLQTRCICIGRMSACSCSGIRIPALCDMQRCWEYTCLLPPGRTSGLSITAEASSTPRDCRSRRNVAICMGHVCTPTCRIHFPSTLPLPALTQHTERTDGLNTGGLRCITQQLSRQ